MCWRCKAKKAIPCTFKVIVSTYAPYTIKKANGQLFKISPNIEHMPRDGAVYLMRFCRDCLDYYQWLEWATVIIGIKNG